MQSTFELTQEQQKYLNNAMQNVSRSFALVVPHLEQPLGEFMALAYLLCRVVDNVEDAGQPLAWQKKRFAECKHLLAAPDRAAEILAAWEAEDWPALTLQEAKLMGRTDGLPLWEMYAQIPTQPRATIAHWVTTMAAGMEGVEDPQQAPWTVEARGIRMLAREEDYNQYCYFVAGTVGHLGTQLVVDHYRLNDVTANGLTELCEACGRALQKTNIVKDFAEDLTRGVCYLPDEWLRTIDHAPLALDGAPVTWTYHVLTNVMEELRESVAYILALPQYVVGYRIASLLCLLPAYQTVLLAARRHERLFTEQHHVKVSRAVIGQCLVDAPRLAQDNDAIVAYSQRMEKSVRAIFDGLVKTVVRHE